jgi:2,4-diaminopentanoate dehydrogenase
MRMQLCFDAQDGEKNLNSAIALTGMAAVNAIPYVIAAEPGIHDPIAGRKVVTRQAVGARATAGSRA